MASNSIKFQYSKRSKKKQSVSKTKSYHLTRRKLTKIEDKRKKREAVQKLVLLKQSKMNLHNKFAVCKI